MPRAVLLVLLVPINLLSCSAFVGDISNRRQQIQPPATTINGCDNFHCRFWDQYRYKQKQQEFATTTTHLSLHPTTGASLAIVGSSLFGMQISRLIPSGGILGTLVSAAFFGNVCTKWIPNKHPLYDLCFSLFLPGSLTLLLLSYRPPRIGIDFDGPSNQTVTTHTDTSNAKVDNDSREKSKITMMDAQNSISACIRRIAMPFLITSLASLLGCLLSYWCALTFRWFQDSATAGATAAGMDKARELARITTGCMSASYVGGSINFMSTARIVGAPADLLGSLVTADLFTMAIYFSFLSSSLDWEWLVSKFASVSVSTTGITEEKSKVGKVEITEMSKSYTNFESINEDASPSSPLSSPSVKHFCLTSIPLLISTFFTVQLANRVEDVVGRFIPGIACALIAIVAPLLNSLVQAKDFWKPFSQAATTWSDFFFLSFFASIGVAVNLSSVLSMGPACLLFSIIALTVHVLGTVFGCLLWKKVMSILFSYGSRRMGTNAPSLDLEDVWIASNAAIGGPATAAAFCGRMKERDPSKLQGRTISATVWGVVGYAIGTIVGTSMYRMV